LKSEDFNQEDYDRFKNAADYEKHPTWNRLNLVMCDLYRRTKGIEEKSKQ